MNSVLDPRFNYKKLKKDYATDIELLEYLEEQKKALHTYFNTSYPPNSPTIACSSTTTCNMSQNSGIINFAAIDLESDGEEEGDELEQYFDAPRASSQTNPVQWWYARKTELPRLYEMAQDFMSIPGR
jgi:hypothetical protein